MAQDELRAPIESAAAPGGTAHLLRLPSLGVIARILLGGAVLFAVLMAAFPLLGAAYTPLFRGGLEVMGKLILDDRLDGVEAIAVARHHAPDTRITVIHSRFVDPQTGNLMTARYHADVGSYHHGYMPFMVFSSLLLVTRLPWRRKLRPFLWGALFVHLFVGLRVAMALYFAHATARVNGRSLQDLMNPTVVFVIEAGRNLICDDHLTAFVIPIVIWAALCLLRPAAAPEPAAPGAVP